MKKDSGSYNERTKRLFLNKIRNSEDEQYRNYMGHCHMHRFTYNRSCNFDSDDGFDSRFEERKNNDVFNNFSPSKYCFPESNTQKYQCSSPHIIKTTANIDNKMNSPFHKIRGFSPKSSEFYSPGTYKAINESSYLLNSPGILPVNYINHRPLQKHFSNNYFYRSLYSNKRTPNQIMIDHYNKYGSRGRSGLQRLNSQNSGLFSRDKRDKSKGSRMANYNKPKQNYDIKFTYIRSSRYN